MNFVHPLKAAHMLAALCAATAEFAGALTVNVVDATGKPLLEPTVGEP